MLAGIVVDQPDLGLRHILGEDTADPNPARVDVKHHLSGFFLAHAEKVLQHDDDEIHGSEIIIQQDDFVQRRPLQFRLRFLDSKLIVELVVRILRHLCFIKRQ